MRSVTLPFGPDTSKQAPHTAEAAYSGAFIAAMSVSAVTP